MKSARRKRAVQPEPRDRTPRRDLVENEIFERATTLFAERGFSGTSLQDIADAMGMTRPALYYYVDNTDALLAKLVAEITEGPAAKLAQINADTSRPPIERLGLMVRTIVMQTAEQPSRFRLLILSEPDLPPEIARIHERGRRKVLAELVAVLEDSMRVGQARPVDARVAALGILGLCNWVAWWHHDKDGRTSTDIAEQFAEMAVLSVAQTNDRKKPGLLGAIELLRQDLEYLERATHEAIGPRNTKSKRT